MFLKQYLATTLFRTTKKTTINTTYKVEACASIIFVPFQNILHAEKLFLQKRVIAFYENLTPTICSIPPWCKHVLAKDTFSV